MFLKKKAYITINYAYVFQEKHIYKVIDSYTINILKGHKIWSMKNLDPNNTKLLIDKLVECKNQKKELQLEKIFDGYNAKEYIVIPKWAMTELIEQIYNCIGYTSNGK